MPRLELGSARLEAEQIPALWRSGPVQVADHTRADSMDAIAADIPSERTTPLCAGGTSMDGDIALTGVKRLRACPSSRCLDTSARPRRRRSRAKRRKPQIVLAQGGRFDEVPALQFPIFVHRDRQDDAALRARVRTMADETGAEAFLRQQKAIATRPDVRPVSAAITSSDPGAGRRRRRADAAAVAGVMIAAAIAGSRLVVVAGLRTPLDHGSGRMRVNGALSPNGWRADDRAVGAGSRHAML